MAQETARYENLYSQILSRLYTASSLTSSELVSILKDVCSTCNRTKQAKKFFHVMESLGVNVLPDVMVHKLRFKIATVVARVKKIRRCPVLADITSLTPYVRSISLSYPNRVIVTAYIPVEADVGELLAEEGRLSLDVYTHEYIVRSKPLPAYLFSILRGLAGDTLGENSFSMCIENRLQLPEDWGGRPKISSLALHILSVLSTDPSLTVEEVSNRISERVGKEVPLDKVRRYVGKASRFIYGYRVSITKAPYVSDVKLCIAVKGLGDPAKFCLSLVRHPLVLGCSWNDVGEALVYVSLPEVGLAILGEALHWFIDQFGGEVVDIFEYIAHLNYTVVVNIPYTEWSPLLKSWKKFRDLNIVSYVVEKLRQNGCIDI